MKKTGYNWVIYAICFLTIFVTLGFCSSSKSVFLSAITEALHIKRSLYSITETCRYVVTTVVNVFFGTLISKFGARKLLGAGYVALIISMLLYANATNVFVFYAGGCFLGIGLGWTSTTMVSYIINSWCHKNKGAVLGVALAANGVGSAVATQIVTPIIYQEGNAFGYQQAYQLIAIILAITGIIVVLFYRNAKTHVATQTEQKKEKALTWEGISVEQAVRKPYFYIVAVCVFLTGTVLQGTYGISAAHLTDVGIDAGYMATVISVQSLVLSASKFLCGVLYDRFGLRVTILLCDVSAVVAFVAFSLASPTEAGKLLAMIFGVLSSLAMPLETIMIPFITEHIFGQRAYTQMLGIIMAINTAGFALGAPLMNFVYDISGTYKLVLIALAMLMAVVTIGFQMVLAVVKQEKRVLREGV